MGQLRSREYEGAALMRRREESARARMLRGVPVQGRRLNANGITTFVLEGGQGPTLVLLHGGIESGGVYWAPVIGRLAQSHRVVVPDAPGLGESEPAARLDAATFSGWFAALLRLTCVDKPTLIAHSLMGSLAARFAVEHSDVLHRLVLWASPGVGPYRLPLGLRFAGARLALRPSERHLAQFARWPFVDVDQARRRDPEWFEAFFAYLLSRASVPHIKRTMRYLLRTCTRRIPGAQLQRIEVPTTLLYGRLDRMVPRRVGEIASATLGWPLHVLHDAGHVPQLEQPDQFVDALARAIQDVRPG